jgi:septal ring factor EnvC (AmiA/AmiB activator)
MSDDNLKAWNEKLRMQFAEQVQKAARIKADLQATQAGCDELSAEVERLRSALEAIAYGDGDPHDIASQALQGKDVT